MRKAKKSGDALRKRYETVMGAINESVYEWDLARDRFWTSESMQRLLGLSPGRLTLDRWRNSIHPDDYARFRDATVAHLKGETERFECDYRFRSGDGTWHWARTHGLAVRDRAGRAVRMVGSTGDITELKRTEQAQSATAEILRIISGSPTAVQPVFEAILTHASRLCGASFAAVFTFDGELLRNVAHLNASPEFARFLGSGGVRPSRETTTRRCALERRTIHTADLMNDPELSPPEAQRREKVRTSLSVPMFREGALAGVITLWRAEVRPFTGKQIALVETFAAQAVIAIENVRHFNETREALEQQKAIAEVLGVVTQLQTDVQPVFEAIGRNAAQLCSAMFSCVYRFDGELLHLVAIHNLPPAAQEVARTMYPMKPDRSQLSGRAVLTRAVQRLEDVAQDSEYAKQVAVAGAWRRFLAVPMLREGKPLGVIGVGWPDPGSIPERQVELLKTFADQAVIAIEKVRLFNETREALEQQTAISEILQVISGSPTDVRPVLSAVAERAARLCEAEFVTVFMAEDGLLRAAGCSSAATSQPFPAGKDAVPFDRSYISGRAAVTGQTVHLEDVVPLLESEFAGARENQEKFGFRTLLAVPLLRNRKAIGVIAASRRVVRRFSDKQVALVETFADQAVIAIENVRLFNETKDALEQQKASGEVLTAISSSIADTAPVFDKILESCQRLFAGTIVGLNLVRDDGMLHIGAYQGAHREEFERIFPIPLTLESGSGLAILEQRVVHYPDATGDEVPERTRRGCKAIGVRSAIFAPVLWEGHGLGAIFVGRDRTSSFSEKEIALLRTFTDQAAIAIENARLFREIQEKSRQLEVASRHKSEFLANMSHELRTPLNAIIGFARIVARHSQGRLEPKQFENLEKIQASGQHLLALINAILDLSKVEAGRVEIQPGEVALAPVLEQCLRTIEPLVRVALVKEFDGGLPSMYVDEEKLRRIVLNLLSNAAKFTERGTIRLKAQADNGSVAIAVADTGIGIPGDKLALIFEEFEQVDASINRAHGGTGLGLAIAQRLARLMGGDIGVESTLGGGSTFTLTLPLRYSA